MLLCAGREFAVPAEEETDAGGEKTEAKTGMEPCKESERDARDVLEANTQGNHKGNYEVTFEAEGFPDRSLFLGHGHNTCRILPDYPGEHHIEGGKDKDRQRNHP